METPAAGRRGKVRAVTFRYLLFLVLDFLSSHLVEPCAFLVFEELCLAVVFGLHFSPPDPWSNVSRTEKPCLSDRQTDGAAGSGSGCCPQQGVLLPLLDFSSENVPNGDAH